MTPPYTYRFALLGVIVKIRSRSEAQARLTLLRRYLRYVNINRDSWPVTPTLCLVESDDPRSAASVQDPRLAPPTPEPENPPQTATFLYSNSSVKPTDSTE